MKRLLRRVAPALLLALACSLLASAVASAAASDQQACPDPPPGYAACQSRVITPPSAAARAQSRTTPAFDGVAGYLSPGDLQSAYALPGGGAGQTVAIVDAYDNPNVESDLAAYRAQYGLGVCTSANGCFRKVDQRGGTSYPRTPVAPADGDWTFEIDLDVEMVSAACPGCHILLVETDSNAFSDLTAGVDTAASLGATVISNSYSAPESLSDTLLDSHYHHAGVVVTAASGDGGYGVQYPAADPEVTAVGGTTLARDGSARGWSESVWSQVNSDGSVSAPGSGCSQFEPKPAWQVDPGCADRTVADVSAVADSVSVYTTFPYGLRATGWVGASGTSVSSPLVAAIDAQADRYTRHDGPQAFYLAAHDHGAAAINDVVSGNNGSCGGSYLCTAGIGFDGPTGLGTPRGIPAVAPPAQVSRSTARDAATARQWLYYPAHDGSLWLYYYSGTGWGPIPLAPSIASGTTPAIARDSSTGDQWVYYVGGDGALRLSYYDGTSWATDQFGAAVAPRTSPAVVRDTRSNEQWVYYVGSDDTLWFAYFNGIAWVQDHLGGAVAAGTTPTVVRDSITNRQWVYYVSGNGTLQGAYYNGTAWSGLALGQAVAVGTSPTALRDEHSGEQWVYYSAAADTALSDDYFNGVAWVSARVGGSMAAGTTPAVVRDPVTSEQWAYYVASDGTLEFYYYNGALWTPMQLGAAVKSGTSPTVIRDPNSGEQWVDYVATTNAYWEYYWNGGGWGPVAIGGL